MYQRKFKRVDPCPKNCEKKEGCTFNAQVSWDTVEKNGITYAENLVVEVFTPEGSDKCDARGWAFKDDIYVAPDGTKTPLIPVLVSITDEDGTATVINAESLDEPHRREYNPLPYGAPPRPPLKFDIEGSWRGYLRINVKPKLQKFSVNFTIKCYCSCKKEAGEALQPGDLTITELPISVSWP